MLSKKIAIAAIAGISLLAAAAAHADDYHFRGPGPQVNYGHRHHGRHHYRHVPQRIVLLPVPAYYYAPPRPVIFGQIPIGDVRLRVGMRF